MQATVCLLLVLCSVMWVGSLPHIPGLPNINTIIDGLILKKVTDLYTLNSKASLSEKCRIQSAVYGRELAKKREWALRMLDASSKLQSGLFSLNLADLGAFDQCLAIDTKDADDIQGKQCIVSFIPKFKWEKSSMRNFDLQNTSDALRISNTLIPHPVLTRTDDDAEPSAMTLILSITWTICVPHECTDEDVKNHLIESLPAVNHLFRIYTKEANCQTLDTQYKMRQGDWWFVGFLILIGCLMILSTSYDIYLQEYKKQTVHPLLSSFSCYTNGKKLLYINKSPDQLPCLNGIRFFSMMWIILYHQYGMEQVYALVNFAYFFEWKRSWASSYLTGSTISVDTFFLLSGCLLMFGFMKSREKKIPFNIPLFYLHRYLRLTPAYAAIIVFHICLLKHMGSGPLFPDNVDQNQYVCEKWWWTSLLYVQNYVNPIHMCLSQTWYLQVDMQLFWLSPLVVWPCVRWPKYTRYFLGILIAVFVAIPTYTAAYYKLDAGLSNSGDDYTTKYYMATQIRACTWLVGIALGYLLFQTKGRKIRMTWRRVALGWIISGIVLLYVLFGTYENKQKDHVYEPVFNSMFLGLHRTAWCLGVSWVIFACIQGYGGPVNAFLSLPLFQVLGRLTYCMYLIHPTIQILRASVTRSNEHFSDLDAWYAFWGTLCFAIIGSVVWVMAFETPVGTIEAYLLKPGKKLPPKEIPPPTTSVDVHQEDTRSLDKNNS